MGELAPLGRRLAAWVIDAALAGVLALPALGLLQLLGGSPEVGDRVTYGEFFEAMAPTLIVMGAAQALLFVVLVAFDGGPRGATPGKRVMGLRVLQHGTLRPLGYNWAAIRRLVYLLGGAVFYAGWWLVFVDRRRRAWHDLAARSLVVRTR